MASAVTLAKALIAVITFLNSIVSIIYSKLDAENRAKLRAALTQAKNAITIEEAADAANKINDAF